MNKILFRVLISFLVLFFCFILYLGSTEVIINPKLIEKEFQTYEN
jgi:hypothetical protein